MGVRVFGVTLLAMSVGCSQRSDEQPVEAPDASAAALLEQGAAAARDVATGVTTTLAPIPDLAARFSPTADGFKGSKDGIVSAGWRSAWTERAHHVGARLAPTADRPFDAGVGVSELYRLSLSHVGASPAPLELDAGRGVYRDVYPSTDVTFGASAERLEWAYTLRDDKAPHRFELAVALPKQLQKVRADALGGLEFVDGTDTALLRMPRAMAIDAAGARRDVRLSWDGKAVAVEVDLTGLSYPIVIDPAIETAVWQQRVAFPPGRNAHATVWDTVRKRVLMFGGASGGTTMQDTWEWDGSVWSLRASFGPSARSAAAMAFDSARGVAVLFGGSTGSAETWEWDGTAWLQKCTTTPCSTTRPSGRGAARMAYDAVRNKVVMFGGADASSTGLSDTWTWSGTAWASVAATGPAGRYSHGMAWDNSASRVLMFGGRTAASGTDLNDLWGFNGTAWSAITPTGTAPTARSRFAFTFQGHNGRALVHGGSGGGYLGDTVEYDSVANAWISVAGLNLRTDCAAAYDPTRNATVMFGGYYSVTLADTWEFKAGAWSMRASTRELAASAFDSFRGRIVLFGGQAGSNTMNDTWEYTGFEWTQVCTTAPCSTTVPSARHGASAAYDSARHKFVLYGGGGDTETWEYDGNLWTKVCTDAGCTKPPAKWGPAMAYDAARGKVVMFGGSNGGAQTWEFNGTTWTQVCTTAPCSSTVPTARQFAGMTYDSDRGRMVLFGGTDPSTSTLRSDTWEFTGTAWIQVATTGPSARERGRLAYDPVRKKTVLFGGSASGGSLGDTWEWDGSTWTQTVSTASGPGIRSAHSLDYDASRRRIVAYGGNGNTRLGDTWEYYSRGGSCAIGSDCATGYCVDGVCCEQVSCGTCQACNTTGSPGSCASVISADDPDTCPAGTATCDSTGNCRKKQGQSCTLDTGCATGFCADGFCCNSACAGGCDECATTPGTCKTLTKGDAGSGCGAYFCDGASGACPQTCTADTDCGLAYFCAAGGICQARRLQGGTCNVSAGGDCSATGCRECAPTLTCKDGYCCNGACGGSCRTCAATPGTCTNVNTADDADTCTGVSTCSSTGTCLAKNGQVCSLATQCASGNCVDGFCCDKACNGKCNACNVTPGTCSIVAQGSPGTGTTCSPYVCSGALAGCPTACANDADCASGFYCGAGGTCVAQKAQGSTCNTAAGSDCKSTGCRSCASGNCIDGFCCDTACGGSCDACNGAALGWSSAVNGTCALAPVSYSGSPACVGYACSGASAACATTCSSDAQCASTHYCNAAGACVARKVQGSSCNLTTDCKVTGTCRACSTGNCVDGYCCNTACGGQCQACDVAGALGTCVTVTGSVHVTPSRAACTGTGSCASRCNGVDATKCNFPGSALSCGAATCASGVATNVGTCDGAGACSQSTSPCGAYGCGATSCKTSCSADTDCAGSTYFCSAGSCVTKKPNGDACSANNACSSGSCVSGLCCESACTTAGYSCSVSGALGRCTKVNGTTCTSATECGSGKCVDGVCCDSTCTGQCQACNVAGSLGTCSNVIGAPVGTRTSCGGTGSGTTCGSRCDGTSATSCAYPTTTTSCSSASCTAGIESTAGTCNGAGVCSITTKACGAYVCGATSCKSVCSADTDCAGSTYFCSAGSCVTKKPNGDACSANNACSSGSCVSGLCCESACTTAGYSCSVSGALGRCTKVNGTTCTSATECGSGKCVDGVCCDSTCTGQCQACNVAGSIGTCSNVLGAPVGSRTSCGGTGSGTTCGSRCDGTSATSCAYPLATTSCSTASCSAGVESTAGTCNGAGVCSITTKACGAYLCGTSSCKSTCAADGDCASGYFCKAGACTTVEANGARCSGASGCASGNCVDGVCCGSASCGSGERCDLAGSLGKCAKGNGVACASSAECGSGFCVDGVCCDTRCDSQCAACDATGKVGTCSAVIGAPHGTRSSCAGAGAGSECGPVCNGTDMAACHFPSGATSCGANTCKTTAGTFIETHVSVCNGAGACSDEAKTCGGFVCGGTACKSACAANSDCTTGFYCKSGACIPIEGLGTSCTTASTCTSGFCTDGVCCAAGSCGAGKSCSAGTGSTKGFCVSLNGTSCSADSECVSGACVDGVCCDSACNGPCEACNKIGSVGKCVPVVGNPLVGHPACTGTSTDSDCAQRCDGTDGSACKYPSTTTSCGKPSCGGGEETQVSTCDGAGTCKRASKTCAPFVCGVTACLSSCTTNDDCGKGNYCKSGACVKVEGLGKSCGSAAECDSGFCADGVCCSVASCGEGSSCAAADSTTPGACLKKKGVGCTKADDCASGRCVDGVCCDAACDGQCEACDVKGSEGTCTPVVGEPHGATRKTCDDKAATDCAKSQCDGKARDKCAGFLNAGTTSCGVDACTTDKRFQKKGACDGAGGCAMPEPKPCTPYACDATSPTGCKSTCASNDECATDYMCDGGACVQSVKCSEDRLSSVDRTGETKSCAPYRCGADGKCSTSCGSSDDCAPGTICDTTVKACVVLQIEAGEGDGGCSVGSRTGRSSLAGFAALLSLALLARRRSANARRTAR